jgi:RNA polymerase sigma factor (sigma-70 family)
MAKGLNKVLHHLHRTLAPPDSDLSDEQLLARFVASRDEASFAALLRRHGPMAWRLCLRVLGHVQNAEDTFQATFLVLACKAASVLQRESVGSFLYGVAYRTALKAKSIDARRRSRERQVEEMPHPAVSPVEVPDWQPWPDHELHLLPEKYRAVIVACDLEGRSRKEVARSLGLAEGTISTRLARGHSLLAKRLSRHGLSLSAGALALVLSEGAAPAVPASLVSTTVKIAVLIAAGELSAVSTSVGILMKGVFQSMLLAKLKLAVGVVMVVVALGASGLVYRAAGQSGAAPAGKGGSRPPTEMDVLKQEVELLKLKLEVVEQKLRAQEGELRALRTATKGDTAEYQEFIQQAKLVRQESIRAIAEADPLQAAEDALKALREARDDESRQKEMDALEKALKKMREQQKKQETPRK